MEKMSAGHNGTSTFFLTPVHFLQGAAKALGQIAARVVCVSMGERVPLPIIPLFLNMPSLVVFSPSPWP